MDDPIHNLFKGQYLTDPVLIGIVDEHHDCRVWYMFVERWVADAGRLVNTYGEAFPLRCLRKTSISYTTYRPDNTELYCSIAVGPDRQLPVDTHDFPDPHADWDESNTHHCYLVRQEGMSHAILLKQAACPYLGNFRGGFGDLDNLTPADHSRMNKTLDRAGKQGGSPHCMLWSQAAGLPWASHNIIGFIALNKNGAPSKVCNYEGDRITVVYPIADQNPIETRHTHHEDEDERPPKRPRTDCGGGEADDLHAPEPLGDRIDRLLTDLYEHVPEPPGEPFYSDGSPTNEPPGDPSSEPRDDVTAGSTHTEDVHHPKTARKAPTPARTAR